MIVPHLERPDFIQSALEQRIGLPLGGSHLPQLRNVIFVTKGYLAETVKEERVCDVLES